MLKKFGGMGSSIMLWTWMISMMVVIASTRTYAETSSKVVILSDTTFEQLTQKSKDDFWLLKFYAPWCGHCKKLAPTWEVLAEDLYSSVKVASIDCTVNTKICDRVDVKGYPTLKGYDPSTKTLFDYQGARSLEGLKTFAQTEHHTGGEKLLSQKDMEEKARVLRESTVVDLSYGAVEQELEKGPMFIKFFAPWCGHCKKLAPEWHKLSAQAKDFLVARVNCDDQKALCSRFRVRGYPSLKFIKGDKMYEFKGNRDLESLLAFAEGGYESSKAKRIPKVNTKSLDHWMYVASAWIDEHKTMAVLLFVALIVVGMITLILCLDKMMGLDEAQLQLEHKQRMEAMKKRAAAAKNATKASEDVDEDEETKKDK